MMKINDATTTIAQGAQRELGFFVSLNHAVFTSLLFLQENQCF